VATEAERLRQRLLDWYSAHARDLPWRRTGDPYAIWLSEIMLQQTQVATVIPYYERFLQRFPDISALAAAKEEEVLALWSGLGYYRRARMLHRGAIEVVQKHDGRLPDNPGQLRALPGIGRYTAGAIASIAFDLCEPILDGNVRRVLCRVHRIDGSRIGWAEEESQLWGLAGELAQGARPGDLNQALMELGARVCTATQPACDRCPIARACRSRGAGATELPARKAKQPTTQSAAAVAWLRRGNKLLLRRRGEGPLRGEWDLPAVTIGDDESPQQALIREFAAQDLEIRAYPTTGQQRHGIMQQRLLLHVVPCSLKRGRVAGREQLSWCPIDELSRRAISGATTKIARGRSATR